MHWFWRATIAVSVTGCYYAFNVVHPPVIDLHSSIDHGIRDVLRSCFDNANAAPASVARAALPSAIQTEPAWRFRFSKSIAWGAPLALIAVITYGLLTRCFAPKRYADNETRCRECRHILRGITEPRCPECGETI